MSIKNLLPGKIGLGGAPLGNMFRAIPEERGPRHRERSTEHGCALL